MGPLDFELKSISTLLADFVLLSSAHSDPSWFHQRPNFHPA